MGCCAGGIYAPLIIDCSGQSRPLQSDESLLASIQGNVVTVNGSQITIGDATHTETILQANVGIGTTTPLAKLEIEVGVSDAVTALLLDTNDVDEVSLDIQASQTTGNIINVQADSLTTGSAANVISNSASTSARSIVKIHQDHASATGAVGLIVRQDSTGDTLECQDSAGASIFTISDTGDTVTSGFAELVNMTAPAAPTGGIRLWSNSDDFYLEADHVIIGDALGHTLAGTPVSATFVGGVTNTITGGTACTITGGQDCTITTSLYATVAGGLRNDIQNGADYSTSVGGQDNVISGGWATNMGGRQNECGGTYALLAGFQGKSRLSGEFAHSAGRHDTTNGSAQWSQFIVFNTTADATSTKLFLDTGTAPITMPDNSAWIFDIDLIGLETDGTNANAYNIRGAARRDGTGNVTMVGTATTTVLGEDDATWGSPSIAGASNRLEISVVGLAATNINWTATVNTTQVIVES